MTTPNPEPSTPSDTPRGKEKLGVIGGSIVLGFVAIVAICTFSSMRSGEDHSRTISRSELGDDWPLTVESGTIECRNGAEIVFITPGRAEYAVNGTAKDTGDYRDIDAIWAEDPDVPGLRKNIRPLVDAGRALC